MFLHRHVVVKWEMGTRVTGRDNRRGGVSRLREQASVAGRRHSCGKPAWVPQGVLCKGTSANEDVSTLVLSASKNVI